MSQNKDFLIERYKKFELEEELKDLEKKNLKLKKENKKLKKKNRYFKSTKAYKTWQKYAKIKGKASSKSSKGKTVKHLKDIKVALISDQFTYDSFKYEFKIISILPDNWKQQFEKENPDIFFCESTWDGHNYTGNNGPWRGKVSKDYRIKGETRQALFEIVKYCNENNIPTVFWNKEDPPHYRNDRISYAETAKYFDYIFTSSKECISQYKKDFNHPHVNPLMFAGQPKLFNPLNLSDETIEDVVFAGTFTITHEERIKLMVEIFDKIIDEWGKLRIYDRNYYKNKKEIYPEKYNDYVRPAIDYDKTPEVYKKMKWGLNFNTVTNSETMFARRLFELSLTNTLILTNYSKGVAKIFGDNVFYFDREDELPDYYGEYEEMRMNNLYNVLENHTYTSRWKQILDTIGFEYKEDPNDITIIYKVDNEGEIEKYLNNFNEIDYPNKKLKLIFCENLLKDKTSDDIKNLTGNYLEENGNIEKIYIETDKKSKDKIKKEMKTEFWIISSKEIKSDFIKKAMLHYQYLNKRVSIMEGTEKFKLGMENEILNKVISKKKLSYLDEDENIEIETYYI